MQPRGHGAFTGDILVNGVSQTIGAGDNSRLTGLGSGHSFTFKYVPASGSSNEFYVEALTVLLDPDFNINPVPLPGALPLFATALGGFGFVGWRRKRRIGPSAGLTFQVVRLTAGPHFRKLNFIVRPPPRDQFEKTDRTRCRLTRSKISRNRSNPH